MPNFTMSITNIFAPNTIIASGQMNTNLLNDIRDKFNAMIDGGTGHMHTGTPGDGPKISSGSLDLAANYAWTGVHSHAGLSSFSGGISGNVAFDTNLFFIDAVNDKVLVGDITSANADLFQVLRTAAASSALLLVKNTDNTNAASNAKVSVVVGGATAGDPALTFDISGVQAWTIGADNSDSDRLKISSGLALGTNDRFIMNADGQILLTDVDPPLSTNHLTGNSVLGAYLGYVDATGSFFTDYNIDSVTDAPADGEYTVFFDTNFQDAPAIGVIPEGDGGGNDEGVMVVYSVRNIALYTFHRRRFSDGSGLDGDFSFMATGAIT